MTPMNQNRSTWLERKLLKPCPYWQGYGNHCLKGVLAGRFVEDLRTTRTLKHCKYANKPTLTEEQAAKLDKEYFDAWMQAYDGFAANGYIVNPESAWYQKAVIDFGADTVTETFPTERPPHSMKINSRYDEERRERGAE